MEPTEENDRRSNPLQGFATCPPALQAKIQADAERAGMTLHDFLIVTLEQHFSIDQTQA